MVTVQNGGASGASSSRASSAARDMQNRRTKPYKTELNKVMAKKRRLNIHTTSTSTTPPPGYIFLPVGTPPLAERCKELSRQRGLNVSVVNAKPINRDGLNPLKVSHHIYRIGYHFSSGVVDQACEELNYMFHRGEFLTEADLVAKHQENQMARTMAKHGFNMAQLTPKESPSQVRAAILELFPRIPEVDLAEIVNRAWAEGSSRVGNASDLGLPRRVQLATIARIRHTYTDYDRLLKAFEWKEARATVEGDCLQKLIEWRGEHEQGDENDLEEIVRETIVIDDDDEGDERGSAYGSEADDEESVVELGDRSDAQVEYSTRVATGDDLRAEESDQFSKDRSHRYRLRSDAKRQQQTALAREKIGRARERYNGPPARLQANEMSVHVLHNERGGGPDAVSVQGQILRKAPPSPASFTQGPYHQMPSPLARQEGHFQGGYPAPYAQPPSADFLRAPTASYLQRPVSSIEQGNSTPASPWASVPAQQLASGGFADYARPAVMPDSEAPVKRRRVEYSPQPQAVKSRPEHEAGARFSGEVIDLTTPEKPRPIERAQYTRPVLEIPLGYGRHVQPEVSVASPFHGNDSRTYAPPPLQPQFVQKPLNTQQPPHLDPHDPRRSFHQPQPYDTASPREAGFGSMSGIQQTQTSYPLSNYPHAGFATPHPPVQYRPQVIYKHSPARHTPLPVHGAPAPVQQVHRDVMEVDGSGFHRAQARNYSRQPTVPPPAPPKEGAPHPAQMYGNG